MEKRGVIQCGANCGLHAGLAGFSGLDSEIASDHASDGIKQGEWLRGLSLNRHRCQPGCRDLGRGLLAGFKFGSGGKPGHFVLKNPLTFCKSILHPIL